jgi:signal transduction histidine kinase
LLAAAFVILPWLSTVETFVRFLFAVVTIFCTLLFSNILLHRGRVQQAGYLLTAVLWRVFALLTLMGQEGLTGPTFLGAITLIPLIAGFVSGTRTSIIVTLLNWLMGGVLVWWELSGRIPIGLPYKPQVQYLAYVVMFSAFPLLVYLWRRNFDEAIEQMRAVDLAEQEMAAYRMQNEALEEAVAVRTTDLEQSLARERHLAEQLAQALEAETQLGELRSRILTIVSHEFRTPLSVIYSSTQLLHQSHDKLPQARRDAVQQRIAEAVFYLNDLLKDIMLVDQAQRERLTPTYQTFAFNEMCQRLIETVRGKINQLQRVSFEYIDTVETPVQTDLTLLEQVVGILVSNGLKYSEKTSQVRVRIWLDETHFAIEVQDQGIGVPLHEQAKIFELFYRASNVDERRGLGLGLFIGQAMSKMMQGRVTLVSQGEGTTFQVRLPLAPELEQKAD